jgi:cardiolipin synthase
MELLYNESGWLLLRLVELSVIFRIMLRPHREPSSRIAWIVVVAVIPVLGLLAYIMLGEVNLGRRHLQAQQNALQLLPSPETVAGAAASVELPAHFLPLFKLGQSINGFSAVKGNYARLMADSNTAIDTMVADIDGARQHVHVLFYIWLSDNNGLKVAEALKRAVARGVCCRALADGLGSRAMITSKHWSAMREAGVKLAAALPLGNPLLRPVRGRIDLRNHRKIVVIDGSITYCGSQNCADPEFRVKPKFAPWVDILLRFQGPIVAQNQHLFACDWMSSVDEDLSELFDDTAPLPVPEHELIAQVIGTGPSYRNSAMPEVFTALMYSARRELTISTPYFVPNEAMLESLCSVAYRGVKTTLILPARNDSAFVGAASRGCYADLLDAGVQLHEYQGGLLHAKTLTVDGEVALIGSANMDRRSLDLNFENDILLYDRSLTAEIYQRQCSYVQDSKPVTAKQVAAWSMGHRIWNNTAALLSPVL